MDNNRFLRHSLIDWFDIARLRRSSVVVVGAGAIGNEVLKNLCLLGVGRLHVIDFDIIELHNLPRTVLFASSDIGRPKAEVAAEACRKIDPECVVTYSTTDFWESLSMGEMKCFDAVLSCVDNFEARIRLNRLCFISQVDFYSAAIDSRAVSIEQYPFGEEMEGACYQCNLPMSVYTRIGERYSCGWLRKTAIEEKKVPTTIITSSIAAAQASSLFLQRHHPDRLVGAVRAYTDTVTLRSTVSQLTRAADCQLCSTLKLERHIFRVKGGAFASIAESLAPAIADIDFYFSDPLILDAKCKICGEDRAINDRAEKYDEALLICLNCNVRSNDITFADSMSLSELARRFSSQPVPVKFISFEYEGKQFFLEMEA